MSCCKQKSSIYILKDTDVNLLSEVFDYSRNELEVYVKIANETGRFRMFEGTIDECKEKSIILSRYRIPHQCTLL